MSYNTYFCTLSGFIVSVDTVQICLCRLSGLVLHPLPIFGSAQATFVSPPSYLMCVDCHPMLTSHVLQWQSYFCWPSTSELPLATRSSWQVPFFSHMMLGTHYFLLIYCICLKRGGGADTILYPSLLSRPSVDHNVTFHSVVISQEVRLCNTGEFWQCHGSSCCFSRYTFTPLFSCLLNDVMVFHTWPLCVWHISWQPYSQLWVVASFRRYIICSFLSEGWMSRSLDDLALYHEHLGSHWF